MLSRGDGLRGGVNDPTKNFLVGGISAISLQKLLCGDWILTVFVVISMKMVETLIDSIEEYFTDTP